MKFLRGIEWFAVASIIFLVATLAIALLGPQGFNTLEYVIVTGTAAVVSAVLSIRAALMERYRRDEE